MTGPETPPPPPGPGRPKDGPYTPLDPRSPRGIEIAERLTRTLAAIKLELAESAAEQGEADQSRRVA